MVRKSTTMSGLSAVAVAMTAGFLLAPPAQTSLAQQSGSVGDPFGDLPPTITLTGIVRDFNEKSVTNGHPDFENKPAGGFAHYMGNLQPTLDADKKPVFKGDGRKVSRQWTEAGGKNIHPSQFRQETTDRSGAYSGGSDAGGITSVASFAQWYRDVPGVNASKETSITLTRQANSNLYVFDDRTDPLYRTRGGFFPINNELLGNSRNETKNFHFTFEVNTEFLYKPNTGQSFTFIGDDDVWVFINDQLVIDLGGVHSAITQTVLLDRLNFLIPNGKNTLRIFHAERHRTQSNFRVETTINLRNAELPNTSALFD